MEYPKICDNDRDMGLPKQGETGVTCFPTWRKGGVVRGCGEYEGVGFSYPADL